MIFVWFYSYVHETLMFCGLVNFMHISEFGLFTKVVLEGCVADPWVVSPKRWGEEKGPWAEET